MQLVASLVDQPAGRTSVVTRRAARRQFPSEIAKIEPGTASIAELVVTPQLSIRGREIRIQAMGVKVHGRKGKLTNLIAELETASGEKLVGGSGVWCDAGSY